MTKLSVNVNKVALLRNTRPLNIPNVLKAAESAIRAGAHGITVHPRPDQRHIRPDDVYELAALVAQGAGGVLQHGLHATDHRLGQHALALRQQEARLYQEALLLRMLLRGMLRLLLRMLRLLLRMLRGLLRGMLRGRIKSPICGH